MLKLPLRPHLERQFDSLPEKVKFCKRCVMSNQRPRIEFDDEGICQPCRYYETRDIKINWEERKEKLLKMLDNFRSKDGSYDVIVPCSGGKDTSMLAHRLKYEYGMHPLCYTFAPPIYTEIGWKNLRKFIDTGFDHFLYTPGGPLYRSFCKIGLVVLGDHLEIWDRAVLSIPPRLALQNNVKLIMYGENAEVEYGGASYLANKPNMPWENFENIYYSTELDNLIKIGIEDGYFTEEIQENTCEMFRFPPLDEMKKAGIEYHWFSYYHRWDPQENYYYSVKHTGFEANPEGRMEGTYSKYAQLDDLLDSFLYYMMFIKYGIGRATSDAAHEIRDQRITREEGVALVKRFDGEFPKRNFQTWLEYLNLTEDEWWMIVNLYRQPHIWKKKKGKWVLRAQVS